MKPGATADVRTTGRGLSRGGSRRGPLARPRVRTESGFMSRERMLARAMEMRPWDVIVVGGGCTGIAAALDAAGRGYRTLLVERGDFTSGTSSRSTKLIHGGVRYLRQRRVQMVYGALRERYRLWRNAPHLVDSLPLVVPAYRWWERPYYGVGLMVYDALAGRRGFGRSRVVGKRECGRRVSTLERRDLRGGVIYHDGQFDDSRLGWTLLRTAANFGAVVVNYAEAVALRAPRGRITGVRLRDRIGGDEWVALGAVVINATGPFADAMRGLDDAQGGSGVVLSRGTHIVVRNAFLPGNTAVLIPSTDDGRVLFAIPWHGHVLIGTTDVPVAEPDGAPAASDAEVDYLIDHASRYLTRPLARSDVLSAWAGLRSLAAVDAGAGDTATLSRDHAVSVSRRGLVTVVGGKWTTCRKVGQDTVDVAAEVGGLSPAPSVTARLRVHGYSRRKAVRDPWKVYGSEAGAVRALEAADESLAALMHPGLPYRMSQVAWAARHEMAVRVEDVLARRTRTLFLNAGAAMAAAPGVARVMAAELGYDGSWVEGEVRSFRALAKRYLPAC